VEVIRDHGGYSEPQLRRSSRVRLSSDADLHAGTRDTGDDGEQVAVRQDVDGVEVPVEPEEPPLWWQQDENWNSFLSDEN
jgi:hypothetical protein